VQRHLFKAALDELAIIGEPVNHALEVDLDGDEAILTLYGWPPPPPGFMAFSEFNRVAEIPRQAWPSLSPRIFGTAAAARAT
jgi:hypothetical protein